MPMPPAMKTYGFPSVLGQQEAALRLLDFDLVADLQLRERPLERAVADPGREPQHAALGRRRHDRDVAAKALLVVMAPVGQLDPEVLPGLEVDLLAAQVEDASTVPSATSRFSLIVARTR